MNNKLNPNKTQNLLNILSQKEVLNDLDFENSQKRVYNSILHKMENTNSQAPNISTPPTENQFNKFLNNLLNYKAYSKIYNIFIFVVVSLLSIYGFLSLTGTINNVNAKKVIENRFTSIIGANPVKINSGNFNTFNINPHNTRGGNDASATTENTMIAQPVSRLSDIEIDPKTIKYTCETFENFGIDFTAMNLATSTITRDAETLPVGESVIQNLPKITTFITTCNFPTGSKYITKNINGDITHFNLSTNEFFLEFLGGKYAIKSKFEKPMGGQPFANLNLEATKLQIVFATGLKVDHVTEENGVKYNVYKLTSQVFSTQSINVPLKELSISALEDNISPDFNSNNYELLYVNANTGNLYKSEQYFENKLDSYQKMVSTTSYDYDQALANSNNYDELTAQNIEIKEIVQPMSVELNSDIQDLVNTHTVVTPKDDSWRVSSFFMKPNAEQLLKQKELDSKYDEYNKLFINPDFNPMFKGFSPENSPIGETIPSGIGSRSPEDSKMTDLYTDHLLASYQLVNTTIYMEATIWDGTEEEYLQMNNSLNFPPDAAQTIEKIADGVAVDISYMGNIISGKYYEYKINYTPQEIFPKSSLDNPTAPVNLGINNTSIKTLIANIEGKIYIFNTSSDIDLKNMVFGNITETQLKNSKMNLEIPLEYKK